jgi:putative sigma-54 modulation protein
VQTTITGRHFEVSDAIRQYAEEKIEKLPRIYDGITEAEIVLKGEDRTFHCEVILHVANSHHAVVIDVTHDSMYAAIDVATDKAQRQMRRLKEKRRDHKGKSRGGDLPEGAPPPGQE